MDKSETRRRNCLGLVQNNFTYLTGDSDIYQVGTGIFRYFNLFY